ncbi:MAG: hypothetical protein FD166_2711 [Bacteroidetes bacterium]|nr:MAG: hypothetical protein FD166_2711 [Bacteroidota bacterium]
MPIKLMCAGDLMTGENVHHYHRGIVTKFRGRYNDLIAENVREIIGQSDYLLLNFEASLVPDEMIDSLSIERGVYVAPLESLELLKSLNTGIILNVANNHFGQHGKDSAGYTIEKLIQAGFLVTGIDNQPVTINREGINLSVWGCSLVKDRHYDGSYFRSGYETLVNDLKLPEKKQDDIWILSIHWGEEYYTQQNDAQQHLAEKLGSAGFDYIIGHHPHVIQPVSKIGDTTVLYSHGNFIFDQNFSSLTQMGLVSQISPEDGIIELFFSQQEGYRVSRLTPTDEAGVEKFCRKNFHRRKPLFMRLRMKLELLYRFHELNRAIIGTFTSRLFRK